MSIQMSSDAQILSGLGHHVVGADVDADQGLAFNQNVKRDSIAQIN